MRRDRLPRKAHADVAADLPDPDGLSLERHRREPQAEVITLVDVLADALQRDVLPATEKVQAADRGIAIGAARKKRRRCLPAGGCRHRLRFVPVRADDGVIDVLRFADNDDVQGVARVLAFRVDDAAGQFLERRDERLGVGKVRNFLFRIDRVEIDVVVVDGKPRDRDEKCERPRLLVAEKVDIERLGAFVGVRENEPGAGRARCNPHIHAIAEKRLLGLLAFFFATGQRGNLQRRVVVRVDTDWQETYRLIRIVFDLDPYRLNALLVERKAEELACLFLVRHRRGDPDALLDLCDSAVSERYGLDGLEIETRRTAGQAGEDQCSNEIHRRPYAQCRAHHCSHLGGVSQDLTSISNIETGSTDSHITMR